VFNGVPAPGNLDEPASFLAVIPGSPGVESGAVVPEDGWWSGVVVVYIIFSALAIIGLLWATMCVGALSRTQQRYFFARIGIGAALILIGFPLLSVYLHLVNEVSLALAPSGSEFFATSGDLARLGVGIILGGAMVGAKSVLVLVATVGLVVFYVLAHVLVAIWPLAVLAWTIPMSVVQYFAWFEFIALVGLGGVRILQAAIQRLLFEIPLDPLGDPESAIVGFVVIFAGLFFAFVVLVKMYFSNFLPSAIVSLGGQIESKAEQVEENIREDNYDLDIMDAVSNSAAGETAESEPQTEPPPDTRTAGSVSNMRANAASETDSASTTPSGGVDAQAPETKHQLAQDDINRAYDHYPKR
jgi:hypothetical protein